jgi:cellulose synthase/poly-beta-1,6-N-acetylglucosamine synthase-like glycosyltransferase
LDFSRYLSEISLSVHVGALHLAPSTPDAVGTAGRGGGVGGVDFKIPSVCVLIPVYNGELYLAQCLNSVMTRPQCCSFEVLVVDDGSTDRSTDIADTVRLQAETGSFINNPGVSQNSILNHSCDCRLLQLYILITSDDIDRSQNQDFKA